MTWDTNLGHAFVLRARVAGGPGDLGSRSMELVTPTARPVDLSGTKVT
ncbi:hypothetical protein GCM10009710_08210 [Aeromicrobium alkaliterrae]|uniref:Uncharacterized protein n=1 Tax=Aeromicrobium alkaliterrae TaxID=302168 RepID=A0ABP4VNQ8_9ACTN